ncbi:MAG: mismatch-specific DNA-glycosylase [Methylovirgula sp.]
MHRPDVANSDSLPDLLRLGLDVVFIGINPSVYSVQQGHYFARRTNRFWPAFSRSALSLAVRKALGVETLLPEHDRLLPDHGFGFTDAVKRASARATDITPAEFAAGVASLTAKLEEFAPRVACFHGIMAYRPLFRALTGARMIRVSVCRICRSVTRGSFSRPIRAPPMRISRRPIRRASMTNSPPVLRGICPPFRLVQMDFAKSKGPSVIETLSHWERVEPAPTLTARISYISAGAE